MSTEANKRLPDGVRGALLMTASAILFALMAITIRLAADELHPFAIAFFRNFFGLLFALPLLYGSTFSLRTNRLGLYFVRCIIGLSAMLCGFWALVHLPLAQAVALSYTTPLFVTILAVIILREVVRLRRWTAVAIGFVGALIIVRPGAVEMSDAALIALLSAALAASAAISIKFLSRTEPTGAIVIWMVLIMTPMSLLPALFVWTWPSPTVWVWLLLTGFLGTTGHLAMTGAYKLGDASALTPYNFLQLPVVAMVAWILFGETVDRWTIMGAGIIFAATAYIAHREAVLARPAVTDSDVGGDQMANR
ncbi:MAG TPA: DMT family transporter [Xanthomonadaceae bacterium]|nr:DMT family transporter [Xanthomonadaceae bacterium]